MDKSIFFAVHKCMKKGYLTLSEQDSLNSVIDFPYWKKHREVKLLPFRKFWYEQAKKKYL